MCLLPVWCGIAESLQEEKAVVEDGIVLFVFNSIVCLYKKHGGSVMRQIKSGLILKKCSMIVMYLYIILLIFANVFENITF